MNKLTEVHDLYYTVCKEIKKHLNRLEDMFMVLEVLIFNTIPYSEN